MVAIIIPGRNGPIAAGSTGGSTAAADFVARTVDNMWEAQYTTLIFNLVSTNYTLTKHGSPTFTPDRGFTGTQNAADYLDTGFNPSSGSPHFAIHSAHISAWCNNNTAVNAPVISLAETTPADSESQIFPKFSGNAYGRINDATPQSGGFTNADSTGFYVATRTSSAPAQEFYRNASAFGETPVAATGVANNTFVLLASRLNGTISAGTDHVLSAASIGSGLSAGDVTSLNTEIGTFRTAVGL